MATNNVVIKKTAILDSSALVALTRYDDADYSRALKIDAAITKDGTTVLLLLEVLAETLNVIGKKFGRDVAVAASQAILSRHATKDISLVAADVQTVGRALDIQAVATGSPSYINCLVMAFADQHSTPYIFGFDATFQENGYQLPDVG